MTSLLAALLVAPLAVAAIERPSAPAGAVVSAAKAKATRERKNVMVLFEASWCPWCRRFDDLLADPALAPAWERSYVVAKINVRERGELKRLENPGWEAVMKGLRERDEMDVPYMAIIDARGTKIADSLRPSEGPIPSNAGYPAKAPEIEAFVGTIERTGRFTPEELATLKSRFSPASE